MPKHNFALDVAPTLPCKSKTFTDPAQPGKSFTLTLQGLDEVDTCVARVEAKKAIVKYVTGDIYAEKEIDKSPMPLFVGLRQIVPTEDLLSEMATLYAMQVGSFADAYTIEEFIEMSIKWPQAFDDVKTFVVGLQNETDELIKNGVGESGDIIQDSPSTTTEAVIPRLSREQMDSFGLSTSDSPGVPA